MRLLLDTHCWLWMQTAPDRFSADVRTLIEAAETELLLSAASAWEVAIKYALGKLDLPEPPETYVPQRMAYHNIQALSIKHEHALAVTDLPQHHRDPFDRLLIAQARVEGMPLLTADPAVERYDVAQIMSATAPLSGDAGAS